MRFLCKCVWDFSELAYKVKSVAFKMASHWDASCKPIIATVRYITAKIEMG